MLFPTTVFAIFFAVVFALHWGLVRYPLARKLMLLVANMIFYGYWSWKFACMLLTSALLNQAAARWISGTESDASRKHRVAWSVAANLAVLGVFKYTGFLFTKMLVPLAVPLCARLGTTEQLITVQEHLLPLIERIVLPVGISFFTFQALSYVIDVQRRETAVADSALDFANYLAFFPQLVAGPIVRASALLPQMVKMPGVNTRIESGRALSLILAGLLKKTVVANWLAENLADPVFAMPELYHGADLLLGVYAYALQIYCDFSAYSDIAIGCALLMGFHFPINFNAPYLAVTLQEFWRRWHISLSTWLRDYLYIPLGGSRSGGLRTRLNLLITFLLGGLWHGAGWTFVLWGTFHGIYLSLERLVRSMLGLPEKPSPQTKLVWRWLGRFWIFQVVCFSWILFRSPNLEIAGDMLRGLTAWRGWGALWSTQAAVVLIGAALLQLLDGERIRGCWRWIERWPAWAQGMAAAIALTLILGIGPSGVAPFIYFQF